MNFQQLRYIRSAIRNDLNLTEVANELATSQPGVSKQIRELEAELRIDIFVRRGKRLVGLTKAGAEAAGVIQRILQETDNLKRISDHYALEDKGRLTIAATHNQASYVLPPVLVRFARLFPDVEVELRQGAPRYVAEMLLSGEADIGIATEALDQYPNLDTIPCFEWRHVAIVPVGHPLARLNTVTLADLAAHPIITYSRDFSGGSHVIAAFEREGLVPDLRLAAMDADVIKTYARLGMGVGIVAQMAMVNGGSEGLVALPGSLPLFPPATTKLAVLHGSLLRNYAYRLIEMFAPHVDGAVLAGKKRAPAQAPPAVIRNFADRDDLHFDPSSAAVPA